VNKENLKDFGTELEYLNFHGDYLTSLDADLLDYNPNLKVECVAAFDASNLLR